MTQKKPEVGYIKVTLDYAPTTNGKKMREWCEKHGFAFIGSGRRAWCSSLGTYLRDASGVAYADGEPFLFYEDDLVDLSNFISKDEILKARPAKIEEYPIRIVDRDNPNNVWASSKTHGLNDKDGGYNLAIEQWSKALGMED